MARVEVFRGILCVAILAATGCGGSSSPSTGNNGGGGPSAVAPMVTVSAGGSGITTAQALTVSVTVAGSSGSAAGTVILASGSYASPPVTLSASGTASIVIPAGLLVVGNDTLTAAYTPSQASAGTYTAATGNAPVSIAAGTAIMPPTVGTSLVLPTQSAPFQALPAANGTVFVGEANGLQVFAPVAGVLTAQCALSLPTTLSSQGGQWAELALLPNGVDLGGGIETPGAAFYNEAAAATCTGTPVVVSQGPTSADEGSQAVAVTPDGKFAFVSNEYGVATGATTEGNVGVVSLTYDTNGNVNGGTLLGQITTGGNAIAGMLLSPDGTRLYVTSEVSKNNSAVGGGNPILARTGCTQGSGGSQINGILTVINVAQAESSASTAAVIATVDAGCSPVRMAETPDNSTLWVAARGDNRVLAFSTGMLEVNAANALLGDADTQGAAPVGVTLFHHGQFLAVANSDRFGMGTNANLAIVSASYPAGAAVVATVPAGLFPREVNVGSDDATLYLTNYSSGSLQVVPTH